MSLFFQTFFLKNSFPTTPTQLLSVKFNFKKTPYPTEGDFNKKKLYGMKNCFLNFIKNAHFFLANWS